MDATVTQRAAHGRAPEDIVAEVEARGERIDTPFPGGTIAWRVFGKGRPLVLLHGGFGSWTHWIRNVDFLAQHYRVFAADMAGYGESSDPAEPLAESIANAIIPGIRQLAGGDTVTLVGFSFGGVVCGVIGQLAPDLVDSIVFVGAAGLGLPREPLDLKSWRLTGTAEGRRMLHRHNVRELMIWNDDRIDDLAVYLQQSNAERTRFRSRKIARTTVLRHALEASSGPIAGIWGEHDATAAPYIDERRELLQELRPGTPFTVMPGMGHWVMYEAADDFNPLLLRMIETIKPRV